MRGRLGPRHDRLHHPRLGVGVLLHIVPLPSCQLKLGPLVKLAVGDVGTQVVARVDQTVDLRTAGGETWRLMFASGPLKSRCSYQSGSRIRST
jgi:hypothetical protein